MPSFRFEYGVIIEFDPSKGRGMIRFDGTRKARFVKEDIKDKKAESLLPRESEIGLDIPVRFVVKRTGNTYWAEQITRARGREIVRPDEHPSLDENAQEPKQPWRTSLGSAISSFLAEEGEFPESDNPPEASRRPANSTESVEDNPEAEEVWVSAVGTVISEIFEDPKVSVLDHNDHSLETETPRVTTRSPKPKAFDDEQAVTVSGDTVLPCLGVLIELPSASEKGTVELVARLERDIQTGLWSVASEPLSAALVGRALTIPSGTSLSRNLCPGAAVYIKIQYSREAKQGADIRLFNAEIERIAYEVRPMPENFWTKSSRLIESNDPFAEYYLQVSESLVGPWGLVPRGESFELVPSSPDGIVWEHLVEDIRHTAIVELKKREYVLPLDPQNAIRYLDSKVANELTDWFIEQLSRRLPAVFAHLESEHPSWRAEFACVVLDYGDPTTRQLYQQRWQKAEQILDALVTQYHKFEELVNSNETLQDLLRMNVQHRLEELESKAFDKAEREAQLCLEREREELRQLRKDIAQAKRDLGSAQSVSIKPLAQKAARVARGDAGDQRHFCQRVLGPNLSRWVHNQTDQYVETLHLAALCARNILVPDFAWSRGFSDAFVPDQVVYEQFAATPAWIAPRDLWDAGLSDIWNQSLANPKKLFIGHIADINSSFVQYWALPYLLAGTGVSSRLAGMSGSGWPENLRLFWSPIEDDSIFRLPEHLKRAFSAACPFSIPADPGNILTQPDSSLEVEKWLKWLPDKTSDGDFRAVRVEGPFARPVANEIQTLRGLARDFTRDDTTADIYSRNIRIEWVDKYFQIGQDKKYGNAEGGTLKA